MIIIDVHLSYFVPLWVRGHPRIDQGSFPVGTPGHAVPNLIFAVGTPCPYFDRSGVGTPCPYFDRSGVGTASRTYAAKNECALLVFLLEFNC